MADDKSKKDKRSKAVGDDDSKARQFAEYNGISIGPVSESIRQFGGDRKSSDHEAGRLKSEKLDTEIAIEPGR